MSSAANLDPLVRARIESLAEDYREVYPAGMESYMLEIGKLLGEEIVRHNIDFAEKDWLIMLVVSYANGQRDILDLDLPPGSDLGPLPEPYV